MNAVSLSDWFAFLSLGLSISAAGAIPVVLWVDADYLLVSDWRAVGDRVLVEVVRVRHIVCDARRAASSVVTALLLLPLLSSPTAEVTR